MAEIRVMLTAAFKEAYLELVPEFERATGHRVSSQWVSTVQIMDRLQSSDSADVVIMSAAGLDALIEAGLVVARTDLATSGIGIAVRAGAPWPDITSGAALQRAVLAAESIVYSTGPSGVYLAALFERMGVAPAIAHKVKQVQGEPAGAVVARGEAQIGFQQMCELLPVPGIDVVGPLPDDIQEVTTFSAGITVAAKDAAASRELIAFFTEPRAAPVIRRKGMAPA
jgi:molybdate transport system substrate-binding protein